MPTAFVELFSEVDPEELETEVYESIQAQFEEWDPASAGLATWLTKAYVRIASMVFDLASIVSREAFKTFGETIVKVPPILAAPATANSTWKLIDDKGHTITSGTLVRIEATGDESLSFRVVGDVVVPPESDETEAGEVLLEAVEPGEAYNGLTATPEPQSAVSFVDSIALTGASANGVDAEDEDAYLTRLTEALRLLSLSLIVSEDFEIDARSEAGIARALCIPGYNAEEESEDNPLTFTTFVIDADGAAMGAPAKEKLLARQVEKVPSGVEENVYVADPSYTTVGAKVVVAVLPNFDPSTVLAAVSDRVTALLSPFQHGTPSAGDTSTSAGWVNVPAIYLNEVIAESDRIQGVDRVVEVLLAKGEGELEAEDVELDGPAPLPEPGEVEVVAA
jgi:hypothetical protein